MRKHDGPRAIRQEFALAAERFKSMQQTIGFFIGDAQGILKILPSLSKAANAFSENAAQTLATLPSSEQALADRLRALTERLSRFTEKQVRESADAVLQPLRDLQQQMNELGTIQIDQKSSFLTLESNRAKLEALQKDTEKKAAKIQQYTEKIRVRTAELDSLEDDFIGRIDAIWENRFNVLNRPLMNLTGMISELGNLLREEADSLAGILGPEVLGVEYASAQLT
jgi:chromosome segregation ATPase